MILAITRAYYACFLAIGIATGAMAQPSESIDPRGELTLAEALEAALSGNPDLLASTYELTAAQARIVQASLRPNAEFGVELENFAGSGDVRGTDALETTLSLSQAVELGDKRNLRVSAAEMDLELTGVEQRARQLDVLAEVTRRFIDVVAAQERVRIAADAAALSKTALDAIVTRVEAGRSPEAERSRARIALTRAEIERRQAESQLVSARVALAALWGRPEPQFTAAQATLLDLPPVLTFAALHGKVEQTPDLLRFASEARLRDAELRLARAQARPNIAFSLGVRRFEESSDTGLVAGFTMALPTSDRNQGAIREAQARLAQSHALRDAAQLRIRAGLFALYQELTATRARVESLRAEAVPQAQLALDQTRAGYERGRFSFLELAAAQEELLALRSAEVAAAADYHRLVTEVERLTGAGLTQTNR